MCDVIEPIWSGYVSLSLRGWVSTTAIRVLIIELARSLQHFWSIYVKHLCEIERSCRKKTLAYGVFWTLRSKRQIIMKQRFSYWASRLRLYELVVTIKKFTWTYVQKKVYSLEYSTMVKVPLLVHKFGFKSRWGPKYYQIQMDYICCIQIVEAYDHSSKCLWPCNRG